MAAYFKISKESMIANDDNNMPCPCFIMADDLMTIHTMSIILNTKEEYITSITAEEYNRSGNVFETNEPDMDI